MMPLRSSLTRGLCAVLLLAASAMAGDSGYHLLKTFPVGGEGGWDYLTLDSASRHLYISRGTHVIVMDVDTGDAIGDIPDTAGVHGIALAPELGRGFTSNGRENTVTIFDLNSLKPITKVKVGDGPDAILYDAVTKRVFTFNGRGHDSTVVDAAKGTVLGTIPLDGKPEFAVTDENGGVWVNIEDKNELTAINPAKMEVKKSWPLAPCESPSGLAMDRKNRRLFVGCENPLMAIVDADSGKVLTTLPIGHGVDATKFDAEAGLAFASCGEGVLTIVREESADKFSVLENVQTQPGARTMAVDRKTHNAVVVTAKFGPAPAATADQPRPRPAMLPNSFVVLVFGK